MHEEENRKQNYQEDMFLPNDPPGILSQRQAIVDSSDHTGRKHQQPHIKPSHGSYQIKHYDEGSVIELCLDGEANESSWEVARIVEEENHSAHCQHVGQHREENQSGRDEVVKQELVVFPISSPPDSHQLEY